MPHHASAAPHGTDGLTVVAVVPIVVHVARIEVEVPRVVRIRLVERARPVVAVGANVVERRAVAVTGGGEKNPAIRLGGLSDTHAK